MFGLIVDVVVVVVVSDVSSESSCVGVSSEINYLTKSIKYTKSVVYQQFKKLLESRLSWKKPRRQTNFKKSDWLFRELEVRKY